MKIAIEARPIKWSYGTGIGNYTYCLIEKLGELDQENEYTFLWTDQHPEAYIPFSRPYSFYALPKDDQREENEIPLWLAQEKADLFHLPQNGFRTPKPQPHTKLIVTIHDLIPYFMPEIVRPSFLKRFLTEMPEIVTRADKIVTVSEFSKNDLINVFQLNPTKINVIPSAPARTYTPQIHTKVVELLYQKYQFKRPYILYTGGLNPRKNVAELISAYAKVYPKLPQGQQLIIMGPEGKHQEQLKLLATALQLQTEVIFPGFVSNEDLPLFYNGADLFVYPSLYEGFGLPPIEAMSCGIPVITSNVSSLPEVAGEAALQINPHDTLELAETIYRVLTDNKLRKSMITNGFKQSQKYTWSENARQMLALYQEVVGEIG